MNRLRPHRVDSSTVEPALVPLLDVLFILLLFWLTTVVAAEEHPWLTDPYGLPHVQAPDRAEPGVVVRLDSTFLYVEDRPVASIADVEVLGPNEWLVPALLAALEAPRGSALTDRCVLVAPASTRYRIIARLLYTIGQAGFTRVSLVAHPMRREL
ncbi:MAG: biopolymer transporter ExbD [Bacteroidota bacterium]|nr:biopolymer transporter ExbD [Rhodothermia bacterium]MDW8285431.1 biopolymer transporter ExbD [Bacteroidota bacterium]